MMIESLNFCQKKLKSINEETQKREPCQLKIGGDLVGSRRCVGGAKRGRRQKIDAFQICANRCERSQRGSSGRKINLTLGPVRTGQAYQKKSV